VSVPLEQPPLVPEQAIELRRVEGPETAPEDEVLRGRDGGDGVELEEPEPADGMEDSACRAVEQLGANGNATSFLPGDGLCHD
jgi:hypothetical protein